MGLILRFDSTEAKAAFLERLRDAAPALRDATRQSKTDPCILTLDFDSAGDGKLIRKLLGPDSKAFDDIQMRTF